jgi:hypothetical protein
MPFGKTIEMQQFSNMMRWRRPKERETVVRDRSLRGKQRVKARKASNKI